HIAANRNMSQCAHNRCANRDARRRAIFRNSALRDVDVNIEMTIEIVRQAESGGARSHITHASLSRFLHNVTEFTGEREPALAMHQSRFSSQNLAAYFSPSQSRGETDFFLFLGPELAELNDAEEFVDVRRGDLDLDLPAFLHDAPRNLAGDIGNLALQIPHAGFLGVVPDNVVERIIVELQVL